MGRQVKPFQFLADARGIVSGAELAEHARRAEAIGYDGLVIPDHLIAQLGPVATMSWIAARTQRLRVSGFVLNNDLRHPAVLAQELASIDVLSDGRLDVALGAGWNEPEYRAIGLPFDETPRRQARLAEAVAILKGAFGPIPFSYAGEHYTVTDYDGNPKPVQQPHPPFLIGGGGRRTLELAGREAQIVGLAPRISRAGTPDARSFTVEGTAEKVEWVRAAAGTRFESLVMNTYPSLARPRVTPRAKSAARRIVTELERDLGLQISETDFLESPHTFIGTLPQLEDKLQRLRHELGISSVMVGALGPLDVLVERLAGQ